MVVTRQDSPNGVYLNLYIILLINSISVEKWMSESWGESTLKVIGITTLGRERS